MNRLENRLVFQRKIEVAEHVIAYNHIAWLRGRLGITNVLAPNREIVKPVWLQLEDFIFLIDLADAFPPVHRQALYVLYECLLLGKAYGDFHSAAYGSARNLLILKRRLLRGARMKNGLYQGSVLSFLDLLVTMGFVGRQLYKDIYPNRWRPRSAILQTMAQPRFGSSKESPTSSSSTQSCARSSGSVWDFRNASSSRGTLHCPRSKGPGWLLWVGKSQQS